MQPCPLFYTVGHQPLDQSHTDSLWKSSDSRLYLRFFDVPESGRYRRETTVWDIWRRVRSKVRNDKNWNRLISPSPHSSQGHINRCSLKCILSLPLKEPSTFGFLKYLLMTLLSKVDRSGYYVLYI